MRVVSADEINRVLSYPALIEALREAFRADIKVPLRHHHPIAQPGAEAIMLLMPAWTTAGAANATPFLGCKIVTCFPDNARISKPSIFGSYMLMSGTTGEPLAVMDGTTLTAWSTACA